MAARGFGYFDILGYREDREILKQAYDEGIDEVEVVVRRLLVNRFRKIRMCKHVQDEMLRYLEFIMAPIFKENAVNNVEVEVELECGGKKISFILP